MWTPKNKGTHIEKGDRTEKGDDAGETPGSLQQLDRTPTPSHALIRSITAGARIPARATRRRGWRKGTSPTPQAVR